MIVMGKTIRQILVKSCTITKLTFSSDFIIELFPLYYDEHVMPFPLGIDSVHCESLM